MKLIKSVHTVDTHTEGESTRVVVGGIPKITGHTMPEKKGVAGKAFGLP